MSRSSIHGVLLVALGTVALSLSSCCRGPVPCSQGCAPEATDPYVIKAGNLRITGILDGFAGDETRSKGQWRDRDAIGVFVRDLEGGRFTSNNPELFSNVKYTTLESMSDHFAAATYGITLLGEVRFELTAYYPYQERVDKERPLRITMDSNVYLSDPVKDVTRDTEETVLHFRPVLSQLRIKLSGVDLTGAKVTLKDVVSSATLDPQSGKLSLASEVIPIVKPVTPEGDRAGQSLFVLIPQQNLKGKQLLVDTPEYTYMYTISDDTLLPRGGETVMTLQLQKGKPAPTKVSVHFRGSTISPMGEVTTDSGTMQA